jgi:hypothetical protein
LEAEVAEKVTAARRTGKVRRAAYCKTYASKRFEEQRCRWGFIGNLRGSPQGLPLFGRNIVDLGEL